MTERPPDLIQPVVGYRLWELSSGSELYSAGAGNYHWLPGTNQAKCKWGEIVAVGPVSTSPIPPHAAPHGDCGCGLYSLHSIGPWMVDRALSYGFVIGAVVTWGNLEVHSSGIRAEFARIVALAMPPKLPPAWAPFPKSSIIPFRPRTDLERVAARYGVKLVEFEDLEKEGRRHGIPMPKELRPKPEQDLAFGPNGHVMMQVNGRIFQPQVKAAQIALQRFSIAQTQVATGLGASAAQMAKLARQVKVRPPLLFRFGCAAGAVLASTVIMELTGAMAWWAELARSSVASFTGCMVAGPIWRWIWR